MQQLYDNAEDTAKLFGDLAQHALKVMSRRKISYHKDVQLSPDDILISYKSVLGKYIPAQKRNVIFSRELASKMTSKNFVDNGQIVSEETADEINRLINDFVILFRKGADINNHLSTEIFDSRTQDMLLNTWRIRHVHLNTTEARSKKAMHRNRGDWLLFVVIDDENTYFLDVLRHPKSSEKEIFSSYNFLKIAHSNGWLGNMGFVKAGNEYVSGSIQPVITDDKSLYELYNNGHINTAFEFDGELYMPVRGITSCGNSVNVSLEIMHWRRLLMRKIFRYCRYESYYPKGDYSLAGTITFSFLNYPQKFGAMELPECIY